MAWWWFIIRSKMLKNIERLMKIFYISTVIIYEIWKIRFWYLPPECCSTSFPVSLDRSSFIGTMDNEMKRERIPIINQSPELTVTFFLNWHNELDFNWNWIHVYYFNRIILFKWTLVIVSYLIRSWMKCLKGSWFFMLKYSFYCIIWA